MTDNELIAEFMGTDWPEAKYSWRPGCYEPLKVEHLQYHNNWNWLMPVVEAIESIHDEHHGYFQVHIHSNACDIQGTMLHKSIEDLEGYGAVYMSDPNAILNTKLESTYYNVVEFIKWYNKNLADKKTSNL